LCEQLATHFKTLWCPEYAREYMLTHGKQYDYDDLLTIAKNQVALEEEYLEKVNGQWSMAHTDATKSPFTIHPSPLLFIDTDMYVMKVWCEFVFGKCHHYILEQIAKRKYDLYLICNTDLLWVKDELREYPELQTRQKLYHIYENIMNSQSVPWVDIFGNNEERLQKAIAAVDLLLKIE
jgi:nicotinamide riboside kinase